MPRRWTSALAVLAALLAFPLEALAQTPVGDAGQKTLIPRTSSKRGGSGFRLGGFSALNDSFYVAGADSNGLYTVGAPANYRPFGTGIVPGANDNTAFVCDGFSAVNVARFNGGAILAVASGADSTYADSIATELWIRVGHQTNGASTFTDLDDSNSGMDCVFLTTLDSLRLTLPGNLTPITGAASTASKYPYDVCSRVLFGKPRQTASGVAIPGRAGVRHGFVASDIVRATMSWLIPLNDAFGGVIAGASIQPCLLNRHPRNNGVTWDLYYIPKVN